MTRDYELGFILNPEVSEEQTRAVLDRVEQIVATHGGQIVKVNQWGRRRLAYPIEHKRDGLYIFIDMILTPETVIELERTLKVSEDVLRHMMKKRDPRSVQKERESRAAAEAALAAAAQAAPQTQQEGAGAEVAAETPEEAPPEGEEVSETEVAPLEGVSDDELTEVPPALEEGIEA